MSKSNPLPTLKHCVCGSDMVDVENWKDRRIILTCPLCHREVYADTRRQAYTAWNKGRCGDCSDEPTVVNWSLQDQRDQAITAIVKREVEKLSAELVSAVILKVHHSLQLSPFPEKVDAAIQSGIDRTVGKFLENYSFDTERDGLL